MIRREALRACFQLTEQEKTSDSDNRLGLLGRFFSVNDASTDIESYQKGGVYE